jgi:signal transduction histidine kinase
MNRILLLLANTKNRSLLAQWLEAHYQVIIPESHDALQSPFDLCIIDGQMLKRLWREVKARKEAEQPVFLPFALVTPRPNVEMITRHIWQNADEVILSPVEKMELQARIETLLRTRELSLQLNLQNEDLQSYIHAMSHDLQAPVRAITGFADALLEDEAPRLSEKGQHYLRTIQDAAGQMQELIDSLLDFSRMGNGVLEMQPVALSRIVESCLQNVQDIIEAGHAKVIVQEQMPIVLGNSFLLKTTLTNLLTNALKFVAPGVHPIITISAFASHELCRISVEDNGIGIALEHQQDIFTPFTRLHSIEEYPGSGLGLATVRKAVDLMEGRISITSTPGKGSTFWIELPKAPLIVP